MNKAQELFGEPSSRVQAKLRNYLHEWIQAFIKQSPFCVLASSNKKGACDASPKGGKPGFVKVLDETHLLIPDVAGNKLFQSYSNIESNPQIGLIFFIPGIDTTVRVNGKVRVLRLGDSQFEKLNLDVFKPDEKAAILQGLLLEVSEAYSHCPRSNMFSNLWNTETIATHQSDSPIPRYVAGV